MAGFEGAQGDPRFRFSALGQTFEVQCADEALGEVVCQNFSSLPAKRTDPSLRSYRIDALSQEQYRLQCDSELLEADASAGDLLYALEKDLTVWLQKRRPDLLFLHAAALEKRGKVYVFAADSGSGKSTTAWGLLHHGFRYLSDELAPVDLNTMQVHGYPHALCLKDAPPDARFSLPETTMYLGRTRHVPVHSMPGGIGDWPQPLAAVFLIRYHPELEEPAAHPLKASEAAARLYPNVLNALAHPGKALPAVLTITRGVPCFMLRAAKLHATCLLVSSLVAELERR